MTDRVMLQSPGEKFWRRDTESAAALGEASRLADQIRGEFKIGAMDIAASRANTCWRNGDTRGFDGWNRVCAMLYLHATRADGKLTRLAG